MNFMMRMVYFLSRGTPTPRQSALSSLMVMNPPLSLSYWLKMFLMPESRDIMGGHFCMRPAFRRDRQFLTVALS